MADLPPNLPSRLSDQPEELQKIVQLVRERKELAEKAQKPFRDRWDQYYGLYRNFRRLKSRLRGATERDRDIVLLGERREWGAELFIPYCFTVVETLVPRIISNDPKMLVLPRNEDARDAATRVQELLDVQQKEIGFDLKLQSVARTGLKYGLGVAKTYWDRQVRRVKRWGRDEGGNLVPVESEVVLYEGPQFEPVNIWDFFWDASATSIETAEYVIHRTWRPFEYVKRKVESGEWFPVDLAAVEKMGSEAAWTETHSPRLEAAGVVGAGSRGKLIEVWEYHDRENVYTVIGQELCVQAEATPFFHRELPFQIYRPTPQEHEFVGIGEIEPIAHLQYEINTLRSQRRDNATLVLQKAFMYAEGFVDPELLAIGPGRGIPVKGQNIRDVLQVIEFGDIPSSGYQESEEIKEDIERTTGVSDAVAGGTGDGTAGSDTATGIQLVQQAANVRIALKTRNLEREVIRPAARQFLELDRQYIIKPTTIRVADPSTPEGFRFEEVGPDQLSADLDDPIPDAGSTEPDNPPAKQAAAMTLWQALGDNPNIDQTKLASHVLKEFGIKDAESYVIPPNFLPVDPQILGKALIAAGIDPEIVLQALDFALAAASQQPPDGQEAVPPGLEEGGQPEPSVQE